VRVPARAALQTASRSKPLLRGLVDLNCAVVTFSNEVMWWRHAATRGESDA
jgi:hypothetical protein